MIKIRKSKTADTRTCDYTKVTKETLLESSKQHIYDVEKGLLFLISILSKKAREHDHTKISGINEFHKDFISGFKTQDWHEMHKEKERHHFNDPKYIKNDINLLDVLEQIVDGVMAGMGRSGEYRKEPISSELLQTAYDNTVNLMLNEVVVRED
jgi:hypothetical protein